MNLKWFFLFLLIGLPIGIYLFLQAFGENRFDIPIYHVAGLETRLETCDHTSNDQYYAPFVIEQSSENANICLYGFIDSKAPESVTTNLVSLLNKPTLTKNLSMIFISDKAYIDGFGSKGELVNFYQATEELVNKSRCTLVLDTLESKFVLLDKFRRIRGYYDLTDLKELDRLVTETRILIKEQE